MMQAVSPRPIAAAMPIPRVAGTTAATLVGAVWRPAWIVPAGYLAAVTVGGIAISKGEEPAVRARVPLAVATMHWAWGLGFITSPRHLSAGLPQER